MDATEPTSWWASLKHGGLLIAPSKLGEFFANEPEPLNQWLVDRLRRDVTRLDGAATHGALLDTVLEQVLGLGQPMRADTGTWIKGSDVSSDYTRRAITGEAVKPRRVWQGGKGAELAVFWADTPRLGVGRGRRFPARVVEWLRQTERKIALLTNGRQWRLIHAGLDADAFAEWDTDLWFEEGEPGPQVTALRALLSREKLTPLKEGDSAPLTTAIDASRKGQAELSQELGERVRQAVELLIQEVLRSPEPRARTPEPVDYRSTYIAATRVIMRMVVVLFAEARELLERSNEIYERSYSLQGLREQLDRFAGNPERLRYQNGAWARVLALFRLICGGSPHPDLPIPRYGGGLFEAGEAQSSDPILHALMPFEDPESGPTDAIVSRILNLLCRCYVKVRQGKSTTRVFAPVDFSDLSSEYIGILYEGLLDYELRRAEDDDPIVFLNLGNQPALPLSRLEDMTDKALGDLVEKLKVKATKSEESDDEEEYSETDEDSDEDSPEEEGDDIETDSEQAATDEAADARREATKRARTWARRAIAAGKLVKKPKSKKKEAQLAFEAAVDTAAASMIVRTVLPGEWFLVRWGGTRKGSGTFYTRPSLAVPTVHRTLRPLIYVPPLTDGQSDEKAPPVGWSPRPPEEILALKVCDPAMGSGSFLVASLRLLTDALFTSLHHHDRIAAQGDKTLVTLAEGKVSEGKLVEETLPCRPDDEDFETRLKAILKRYVVERCIYGVDIDPLAVELGRLALWVETLDRDLPFEFLDHKLKVGNALVGTWFDRFRNYPLMAWEREGGDKNHSRGVHFKQGDWTKAIKRLRNGRVQRDLIERISHQITFDDNVEGLTAEEVHDQASAALEKMHRMPVHVADQREDLYRQSFSAESVVGRVRQAFDTWCAIWFWDVDVIDTAPTARDFDRLTDAQAEMVEDLRRDIGFFHWELEFPDVFSEVRRRSPHAHSVGSEANPQHSYGFSGFDAIVGNPPWDIQKPNSKEFFSNIDPLYRAYGKIQALERQRELFNQRKNDERGWLKYCAHLKALSNWNAHVGTPYGDPEAGPAFSLTRSAKSNKGLHAEWRGLRSRRHSYADQRHPYRLQGSADISTYKMYLEVAYSIATSNGRISLITPASLYGDKGSAELRRVFLDESQLGYLYAFQNERGVFEAIHHAFKMCIAFIRKGGSTEKFATRFSLGIAQSPESERVVREIASPDGTLVVTREQAERFSPISRCIVEIRSHRDLEVVECLFKDSTLLGSDTPNGWAVKYSRELDLTNDSKLFPPRPTWEAKGYNSDEYGRWLRGDWYEYDGPCAAIERPEGVILSANLGQAIHANDIEDAALPLYEGRSVGQFDFQRKGWVSGKGRSAVWREIPWQRKRFEPQYLISADQYAESCTQAHRWKLAFMDVAASNVERTAIGTPLVGLPCGNSAPTLVTRNGDQFATLGLAAVFNSLAYDFFARQRCTGLHMNWFVVSETPLPHFGAWCTRPDVAIAVARLAFPHPRFAPAWLALGSKFPHLKKRPWSQWFALTPSERTRLRATIDSFVARQYGLTSDDFAHIISETDLPAAWLRQKDVAGRIDSKKFWLMDRQLDPELRLPVLSFVALQHMRSAEFEESDSDWQLPEHLCLADYGLGHDERAKKPQPVRERLGPRFYDWQLEQSAEESWKECEIHARNILGEVGFAKLQAELRDETQTDAPVLMLQDEPVYQVAEPSAQYQMFSDERTPSKGSSAPPLRRVVDADYGDVFLDIDRPLAKRLFGGGGTYFFLDPTALRKGLGVGATDETMLKLLDQVAPVYEWWNAGGNDRVLTVWWTVKPAMFPTIDNEDPVWLALGSQDGKLCDRVRQVLTSIGRGTVAGFESGGPPVQQASLIEALMKDTVYRFKPADSHEIDVALIAQELIGIGGI